jgi:hypothetical protein
MDPRTQTAEDRVDIAMAPENIRVEVMKQGEWVDEKAKT